MFIVPIIIVVYNLKRAIYKSFWQSRIIYPNFIVQTLNHYIMKKIAVLLFLGIFGMGACAQPQGRPSAEEMAKNQTEKLKKELSLNSDQEKKVYNVFLESNKSREQTMKSTQENRDAMHSKMEASRTAENEKLKPVLSEEQYNKYIELQKKMEAERKERGNKGQRGERP